MTTGKNVLGFQAVGGGVMRFVVALILSFALVWLCAKPLKKHPVPFYVGAVALVALYFWGVSADVRGEAWSY